MSTLLKLAVIVGLGLMIWKLIEARKAESDPGWDTQDKLVKRLPNSVQHSISSMSPEQYGVFLTSYKKARKHTSTGYVAWFFFGLHYAYVRSWGLQFVFWITVGGFGVWWFIDLFRMPSIIREYNGDAARQVVSDISVAQGFANNNPTPMRPTLPPPPPPTQ